MLYKNVSWDEFNSLMDWCDENKIDYDIWNAEVCFSSDNGNFDGNFEEPEVGMSDCDWDRWRPKSH